MNRSAGMRIFCLRLKAHMSIRNIKKSFADTPHGTVFQLFVSGGVVGLCIWLTIIFYAITNSRY